MEDNELDQLLARASQPKPSNHGRANFFEKNGNIIAFPTRPKTSTWWIGLPLAASLVLGLWLGNATSLGSTSTPTTVADLSGATSVDDLMSLIESDV
jgi:hypothetical protein